MSAVKVNGKAGETRSVLRRDFLLHTPDAFVRTPMPGVTKGMAIVHASPRLGAGFLQYTAELDAGGELAPVPEQRFCWVLEGEATIFVEGKGYTLTLGDYAYLPSGFKGGISATVPTRLAVIEKKYQPLRGVEEPKPFLAREDDVPDVPLAGDPNLLVKSLLPADPAFDFAVNTMWYAAGAALGQVEVHVMEHGLLMLEGEGTYRLGDEGFGVQAGDFIWMAPYCLQWFVVDGKKPAKYLIYKDWNRRPTL